MTLSPTSASFPKLYAVNEEVLKQREGMPDRSFEALILDEDINRNQRHISASSYFELWLGHKYSIAWFQGFL